MDEFREVTKREIERATALAATAFDAGLGVLSRVLTTAAGLAITAAASDDPVQAVRRLRVDSGLVSAIESAAHAAQRQGFTLTADAIVAGFTDDAAWRGAAVEAQAHGIRFATTISAADRDFLRAYPIVGHTPAEIAERLAATLRYEIEGALASGLTGSIDKRGLPAELADVARSHATRVGSAVREAYFAGVQASTRAIGAALSAPMTVVKKAS